MYGFDDSSNSVDYLVPMEDVNLIISKLLVIQYVMEYMILMTMCIFPKDVLEALSTSCMRQFTEQVQSFYSSIPPRCQDIAIKVLCTHYYLPCGTNGTIHVPLPICPDVCRYMSETICPDIWSFTAAFLISDQIDPQYRNEGIKLPSCDNTDEMINYLNLTSDCCSNGGVILPQPSTTGK